MKSPQGIINIHKPATGWMRASQWWALPPVTNDCNGAFSLTLPAGVHVVVEATGYRSQHVILDTTSGTAHGHLSPVWDYSVADSRSGGVSFQWIDAMPGTLRSGATSHTRWSPCRAAFRRTIMVSSTASSSSAPTVSCFGQPYTGLQGIIPFEGASNNAIYALGDDLNPTAGTWQ